MQQGAGVGGQLSTILLLLLAAEAIALLGPTNSLGFYCSNVYKLTPYEIKHRVYTHSTYVKKLHI